MTFRSHALRRAVLGTLLAGAPLVSAQAQQATPVANAGTRPAAQGGVTVLAPVDVAGTREAPPPSTTHTDRQVLEDRFIRSIEDLGRRAQPGVDFSRQTNSIVIRGLDGPRVLTVVDGIRIPYLDDGARGVRGGLDTVDFGSLSSVDILRGSDSSSVGSGALAGLVSLRTLEPADLLRDGRMFGASVKGDYDSADSSWGAQAAVAGRTERDFSWLVQSGYRRGHELENRGEVGGLGPTRTEINPQDFTQRSALIKLQQQFGGGHKLGLTGEYFKREADIDSLTDQGTGTSYIAGSNSTVETAMRRRVSLAYDYTAPAVGGVIDSAHVVAYWQRQNREADQNGIRTFTPSPFAPDGPFGRSNTFQQVTTGVSGQVVKQLGGVITQTWTVGGEAYRTRLEQYSVGYDNCPTSGPKVPPCAMLHTNQSDMPDVRGTQWGVFVQNELGFAGGRFTLTPAVRYDRYEQNPRESAGWRTNPNYDGTVPASSSGSRTSPKLLATWKAAQGVTLYGQYAYGFRAPSGQELYQNYGNPGAYARLGNANLKPETSRGLELGTRLGDEQLGGSVSLFDNRYRNFIEGNMAGAASPAFPMGVFTTVNRERVRIYGAEATAHWQFTPGWRAWGALAWAVGKDTAQNVYLNSVAPLKASLGVGYAQQAWGADVMFSAAARQSKVAADTDFQPGGYGLVDLSAWWRPAQVKGLRLQAGLFNAFDRKYWNGYTSLPNPVSAANLAVVDRWTQPGRSFRLAVSYQY